MIFSSCNLQFDVVICAEMTNRLISNIDSDSVEEDEEDEEDEDDKDETVNPKKCKLA